MQTAQHSSGGRMLTRHDSDAAEGGLEASLLATLHFLAGACLHPVPMPAESRGSPRLAKASAAFLCLRVPTLSPRGILADPAPGTHLHSQNRQIFEIHAINGGAVWQALDPLSEEVSH